MPWSPGAGCLNAYLATVPSRDAQAAYIVPNDWGRRSAYSWVIREIGDAHMAHLDRRKADEQRERLGTVLHVMVQAVADLNTILSPFLPFSANAVDAVLGGAGDLQPMPHAEEVTDLDDRIGGRGGAGPAPYGGPQARQQLVHRERLRHVVVGPQVEGLHLVLAVLPRRQHDDGHGGPPAQSGDDLGAVEVRQPEVEQHHVGARVGDGVERGLTGQVLARVEARGFRLAELKKLDATREILEQHYAEHQGKPFYDGLVGFMTSGPVMVQVLEGEDAIRRHREIMGATNPKEALAGTLRACYAESIDRNAVHGSDAPASAAREIAYFFSDDEICPRG